MPSEKPVAVAIAEIRAVYGVHQNNGRQVALAAVGEGVAPPM
jgi:hypothetical protein